LRMNVQREARRRLLAEVAILSNKN
jgi:hypothetical protein